MASASSTIHSSSKKTDSSQLGSTAHAHLGFFETASKMHALGKLLIVSGLLFAAATTYGAIAFEGSSLYQFNEFLVIIIGGSAVSLGTFAVGVYILRKDYWKDPIFQRLKEQKSLHILETRGVDALQAKQASWQARGAQIGAVEEVVEQHVETLFQKARNSTDGLHHFIRSLGTAEATQKIPTMEIWPAIAEMLTKQDITIFLDDETGSYKIAQRMDCGLLAPLSAAAGKALVHLKDQYDQAKLRYTSALKRADSNFAIAVDGGAKKSEAARARDILKNSEEREFKQIKSRINEEWRLFPSTQDQSLDPLTGKPKSKSSEGQPPQGATNSHKTSQNSIRSESSDEPPSPRDSFHEEEQIEGQGVI